MNKPSLAAVLAALTIPVLTLQAQTAAPAAAPAPAAPAAPPAPAYTITLTPAVVSQYMFRGQRLGGPAFEPSIEYDAGNLGVGIWANTPITDKVDGQSDPEIDPYGFYTFTINDSLSVVPGFTFYTYLNAKESNGFYKYTFEPSLAVNYTINGFKLTPKIYYDVVLKGPTAEITGGYTIPLKDAGTELDLTAQYGEYLLDSAVKNSSPDTKAWGNYFLFGISAPFQLNKDCKLTVGYAYTKGGDAFLKQSGSGKVPNTLATNRSVFSLSLAYTF